MRALLVLAALAFGSRLTAADPPPVAFVGVTVIDVAAGKAVPGQTVVVAAGKIADVGPADKVAVPANATRVAADGKFLMPGLWDMHTHIPDTSYLSLFLANGVTGVREMHAFFPKMVLDMRADVASGKRLGPRIVAAGSIVDGPQPYWPGSLKATTPAEARDSVKKLKEMGADFIKVYSSLTPEGYRAVVDEAKKHNLPVAGHCPELVSVADASDAGQRSIEHLMGLALGCSRDEDALRKEVAAALAGKDKLDFRAMNRAEEKAADSFDPEKAKALYAKFVKNQTWHCPTTVVIRGVAGLDLDADKDERRKYISPIVLNMWKARMNAGARAAFRAGYDSRLKTVRALHAAGVPLLAGTDCTNPNTYPGFSLPQELEIFVECGLTPAEALRTASLNPAKFFGEEKTAGTIEGGKRADLVLLDANPLAKVGNVRKVVGVVANGRHLSADELKKLLAEVEAKFAPAK